MLLWSPRSGTVAAEVTSALTVAVNPAVGIIVFNFCFILVGAGVGAVAFGPVPFTGFASWADAWVAGGSGVIFLSVFTLTAMLTAIIASIAIRSTRAGRAHFFEVDADADGLWISSMSLSRSRVPAAVVALFEFVAVSMAELIVAILCYYCNDEEEATLIYLISHWSALVKKISASEKAKNVPIFRRQSASNREENERLMWQWKTLSWGNVLARLLPLPSNSSTLQPKQSNKNAH
jgi:hypothetical protein